jgi:hypothetical protein
VTDGEVGFLVICGVVAVLCMMFKRKKTPETLFIEVIEFVEVRKRPKGSGFFVNVVILAGIAVFIWAVSH